MVLASAWASEMRSIADLVQWNLAQRICGVAYRRRREALLDLESSREPRKEVASRLGVSAAISMESSLIGFVGFVAIVDSACDLQTRALLVNDTYMYFCTCIECFRKRLELVTRSSAVFSVSLKTVLPQSLTSAHPLFEHSSDC